MKKSKKIREPWRAPPVNTWHTLFSIPSMIDPDFDADDELAVEEPPIFAALGEGGRRMKPPRDPEDEA